MFCVLYSDHAFATTIANFFCRNNNLFFLKGFLCLWTCTRIESSIMSYLIKAVLFNFLVSMNFIHSRKLVRACLNIDIVELELIKGKLLKEFLLKTKKPLSGKDLLLTIGGEANKSVETYRFSQIMWMHLTKTLSFSEIFFQNKVRNFIVRKW